MGSISTVQHHTETAPATPPADPLRPLWPVLGFIAVLLLVAVIVLIGHLVERWQDQRKNAKSESLSASDSGRNCSV